MAGCDSTPLPPVAINTLVKLLHDVYWLTAVEALNSLARIELHSLSAKGGAASRRDVDTVVRSGHAAALALALALHLDAHVRALAG